MKLVSRLSIALVACAMGFGSTAAYAEYPDKPIRFVVGFDAGGGTDFLARLLAQKLSERFAQPVVVENRAGAQGSIASSLISRSPPDGYLINFTTNDHAASGLEFKLDYDPVKSFAPVSEVAYVPEVLIVNPTTIPVKTFKELIALAKAKPGQLSYATSGIAGVPALEMALLGNQAGIKMNAIPYSGGAPALTAVLGGEVNLMLNSVTTAGEQIRSGKLLALGVTGSARSPSLPDVPTFSEVSDLHEFNEATKSGVWYCVLAPAGTPAAIVDKLREGIVATLKMPDVQQTLAGRGFIPVGSTPAELTKLITEDYGRWVALKKSMETK